MRKFSFVLAGGGSFVKAKGMDSYGGDYVALMTACQEDIAHFIEWAEFLGLQTFTTDSRWWVSAFKK